MPPHQKSRPPVQRRPASQARRDHREYQTSPGSQSKAAPAPSSSQASTSEGSRKRTRAQAKLETNEARLEKAKSRERRNERLHAEKLEESMLAGSVLSLKRRKHDTLHKLLESGMSPVQASQIIRDLDM